MNPHFFTAPFYFAFIWFRVQGSHGGFAVFFLEDGILVSQPSPLGEGAPKGRIGHWRYERLMKKAERCAAHVGKTCVPEPRMIKISRSRSK